MNENMNWIDNMDWKERNDIEIQLAEADPTMDEDAKWIEEIDWPENWKEKNQIEILLADPLLDTRMKPIWKDAIDDIWRKFWAIWKICDSVNGDDVDFVLWMIDDVESDMSMWNNNDPYQWMMAYCLDGDDRNIYSDAYTELGFRRRFLEDIKGKKLSA